MTTDGLTRLRDGLSSMAPAADSSELLARIRLLEELRAAVAAAQAVATVEFLDVEAGKPRPVGMSRRQAERAARAQVARARRESPNRASRWCGWSRILTAELPRTFEEVRSGRCTEWRAMIVARETAWLSKEQRAEIDATIAPRLAGLGDRRVEADVKAQAYRLEPRGYVDRLANAESERRVSLRPAPDTMAWLGALVPAAQGIAAYTNLVRHADSVRAGGDARSRGQVMADTLVERLTGQATADAVPVEICLVMNDDTLLGEHAAAGRSAASDHGAAGSISRDRGAPDSAVGEPRAAAAGRSIASDRRATTTTEPDVTPPANATPTGVDFGYGPAEPARLLGYGPIAAEWALRLIGHAPAGTPMWIRRLYRKPHTGQLAAMDSRRRAFTTNHRRFIRITHDDTCATPWCNAPVRHVDHVTEHADGGRTHLHNAQGLCEACNQIKRLLHDLERHPTRRAPVIDLVFPSDRLSMAA